MSSVIIIPSRLGSTRLANKALADINGLSMIERVIKQCQQAAGSNTFADIFVATDDETIAQKSQNCGVQAIMTDSNIKTGTDRIYQALLQIDPKFSKYENIINVQGDVPNIDPSIIVSALHLLQNVKQADISTACCPCKAEDVLLPNVVKAVLSFENNLTTPLNNPNIAHAVYFTRNPAPYNANIFYEHIGIYGYRVSSLRKFVDLPQTSLEKMESLEQLRAIENSMKIFATITNKKPISIDTPADLEKARKLIDPFYNPLFTSLLF